MSEGEAPSTEPAAVASIGQKPEAEGDKKSTVPTYGLIKVILNLTS